MPSSPPKPCTFSGCTQLVHGGSRCEAHKRIETGKFNDSRRGSRHQRGYGAAWDKIRPTIMARDRGLCQVCAERGIVTAGSAVDHKVNKAEWQRRYGTLAGVDEPHNLRCICTECHKAKTAREGSESVRQR